MSATQWHNSPPFGLSDIKRGIFRSYQRQDPQFIKGDDILCCIEGCKSWLKRRRKGSKNFDFCPSHHISLSASTYLHENPEHNLIVHRGLYKTIRKTEDRLVNENSEDALTWNVFVGFYALHALAQLFSAITDLKPRSEPELYLWGNPIADAACNKWANVKRVQSELEPGKQIPTEPDIILRVPGQALVLIEAKFRSPNSRHDKKVKRRGEAFDYLSTYPAKSGCLDPLNRKWIRTAAPRQILEQLCRNTIFGHWLAEPGEKLFVINLVSSDLEKEVEHEFGLHLADVDTTFRRITWESLLSVSACESAAAEPLKRYMANKTHSLRPAFTTLGGPCSI
jgi:hypothetical protein